MMLVVISILSVVVSSCWLWLFFTGSCCLLPSPCGVVADQPQDLFVFEFVSCDTFERKHSFSVLVSSVLSGESRQLGNHTEQSLNPKPGDSLKACQLSW